MQQDHTDDQNEFAQSFFGLKEFPNDTSYDHDPENTTSVKPIPNATSITAGLIPKTMKRIRWEKSRQISPALRSFFNSLF
jgi:hypothetical protein